MATAAVTHTFANGTNADGTQVNSNFTSVVNFLNTEVVQRDASIAFTAIPSLPATDPTTDNHVVRKAYVDNLMPAGMITQYGGASAPTGWVLCQGQSLSRTNPLYARLYSAIGVVYGAVDIDNFNVPNLKGRIPVGLDSTQTEFDALAETGGSKTHTLTSAQMPSHTHVQNSHNHTQNSHNHTQDAHNHTQQAHQHSVSLTTVSGGTHDHDVYYSTAYNGSGSQIQELASSNLGSSYSTGSAGSHTHTISGFVDNNTPLNNSTTPTNNSTTATNDSATATNQNAGSGDAHNNLQPYIVVNYIIKL
jgi:microcystin-dependent protein